MLIAGSGMAAVLRTTSDSAAAPWPSPGWTSPARPARRWTCSPQRVGGSRAGPPVAVRTHTIGFSQGASVALATTRALQGHRLDGASAGRTYGVSGAYDLAGGEVPALLRGEVDEPRPPRTPPSCWCRGTACGRCTTVLHRCSARPTPAGWSTWWTDPHRDPGCCPSCPDALRAPDAGRPASARTASRGPARRSVPGRQRLSVGARAEGDPLLLRRRRTGGGGQHGCLRTPVAHARHVSGWWMWVA